jgi:hypothetical protein
MFSPPSSPGSTGDPVFQRRLCLDREAAAYWMPACAGMTSVREWGLHGSRRRFAPPHHEGLASLRTRGPRPEERACARLEGRAATGLLTRSRILAAHDVRVFPIDHPHREQRAQGRPGAVRTHGPRATKKHAAEPQVRAGTPGLPCAMVLTVSFVLSPVRPGFVVTVRATLEASSRPRQCVNALRGGTCIGAPGPHDFAVRAGESRLPSPTRPSQPAPTYRDDAYAPLHEAG